LTRARRYGGRARFVFGTRRLSPYSRFRRQFTRRPYNHRRNVQSTDGGTMSKRKKFVIVGASIAALAAGGAGVAAATGAVGGDDNEGNEQPITGSALDKAEAAALEHTGEGTVTETETGDEESFYEVEVTLDDGSQVDVQLDRDFNVVGDEADAAGEDEQGEG
jgi:uncharacterized membrane protein YkoI